MPEESTGEAAPEWINQARLVTDGERIYVPSRDEADAYGNGAAVPGTEAAGAVEGSGKININTAGKDELMELTGIGEGESGEHPQIQGRAWKFSEH